MTLRLAFRAPFDWEGLLAFLAPRAIPGVEQVEGSVYRRSVELAGFAGVLSIEPDPKTANALRLTAPVGAAPHMAQIAARVRSLFDLDADPAAIGEGLSAEPRLRSLLRRNAGIRVPGAWDRFELLVRAVLGQQVTVAGATRLAGRLAERCGRPLPGARESGPRLLFPGPKALLEMRRTDVGLTEARAETLRAVARAAAGGDGFLEQGASLEESVARLVALPGIGDWTAQYVAMRALGEPDAFPAGDLGLRKAMAIDGKLPTEAALRETAAAWRPWRAYAAMLLWRSPACTRKEKR